MTERMSFEELFSINLDGSFEPKKFIQIDGISFGPGVTFRSGVSVAGIDFSLFTKNDFEVERIAVATVEPVDADTVEPVDAGTVKILGIYK